MKIQVLRIISVGLLVAFGAWGMVDAEPTPPQIWIQDTLEGHSGVVKSVAFSPNSKMIVASDGGTICLWDVAKGKSLHVFHHAGDKPTFSADGKTLAYCGGREIVLRDVASGKQITTFKADLPVQSVVFSPDGKTISLIEKNWISVWDVEKKTEVRSWEMPSKPYPVATCGPVKRPVVAVNCGGVRLEHRFYSLIDAFTGKTVGSYAGDANFRFGFGTFALNRDETIVASVGIGPSVRLWNRATGKPIDTFRWSSAGNMAFALSRDAKFVALGSFDDLQIYETTIGWRLAKQELSGISCLAFSPDGRALATGTWRAVKLWTLPPPPARWKKDK